MKETKRENWKYNYDRLNTYYILKIYNDVITFLILMLRRQRNLEIDCKILLKFNEANLNLREINVSLLCISSIRLTYKTQLGRPDGRRHSTRTTTVCYLDVSGLVVLSHFPRPHFIKFMVSIHA